MAEGGLSSYLFFLRALTPVHAGAGSEVMSPIDLPIQREKHTEWPTIYGSSIKGALRSYARNRIVNVNNLTKKEKVLIKKVFGGEPESLEKQSGMYSFSDARILFFPVKSYSKVFVYVTCPLALKRLLEELKIFLEVEPKEENVNIIGEDTVYVGDSPIKAKRVKIRNFEVYLEEEGMKGDLVKAIGILPEEIKEKLSGKTIVVGDDKFTEIVKTNTAVIPRVRLGENKTVSAGPWYEEYLPPETVMYFWAIPTVFSRNILKSNGNEEIRKIFDNLEDRAIPLGGKETIGKGVIVLTKYEGGGN